MISIPQILGLSWLNTSSPTDYLQLLGIGASGAFVAWKYSKEKRIERSAAGNQLISELESSEWLRLACQMLDWTARRFLLPDEILKRRLPLMPDDKGNSEILEHSTSKMLGALKEKEKYNSDEVLYRDTFDSFLTWLDRLHSGLDSGIFSGNDVRPVAYYAQALLAPRHHGQEATTVIKGFIKNYYDLERFELLRDRLTGR